jgi:hypothetical protein
MLGAIRKLFSRSYYYVYRNEETGKFVSKAEYERNPKGLMRHKRRKPS